jgi:hypothetical protein
MVILETISYQVIPFPWAFFHWYLMSNFYLDCDAWGQSSDRERGWQALFAIGERGCVWGCMPLEREGVCGCCMPLERGCVSGCMPLEREGVWGCMPLKREGVCGVVCLWRERVCVRLYAFGERGCVGGCMPLEREGGRLCMPLKRERMWGCCMPLEREGALYAAAITFFWGNEEPMQGSGQRKAVLLQSWRTSLDSELAMAWEGGKVDSDQPALRLLQKS